MFLLDSGSTYHITCDPVLAAKFTDIQPKSLLVAKENVFVKASRAGTLQLRSDLDKQLVLHNVLYVPELSGNVISTDRLRENGFAVDAASGQ